ncbi:MAG: hypothetical protein WAZ19_12900 [Anaerolineae bacterium]
MNNNQSSPKAGKGPSLRSVLRVGLLRPPRAPEVSVGANDPASALKRELQAFQINILRHDYGDFQAQPRFADLSEFFFTALYAPADFELRNESFRRLHDWLTGLIGHDPVSVLAHSIELYELTDSLDDDTTHALQAAGVQTGITRPAWEAAYAAAGRLADRQRQLELLVSNGHALDLASRVPFVHTQLRAIRPAAGLLGWGHVVDFLLRGQEAIAQARPIDPLLEAMTARERARMAQLIQEEK